MRWVAHAIVAAAATLLSSRHAGAQGLPQNDVEAAKVRIASGDGEGAQKLLEPLHSADPRNVEFLFLLGMSASVSADYDAAVGWFRKALVLAPDAIRIRLELARAFYLDKDYENAFRQFQFARAGDLPPGVVASIDRYLVAIRQEKNWSYNLSVALAPDSNLNNATSVREAELFGLPFNLSDEARQRRGVGLSLELGGEFAPRLSRSVRWRIGAAMQRREYDGGKFDDMTVAVHTGPRLILPKWDLSLLGTGLRRWHGGERYIDGYGALVEATHYPNGRMAVSVAVGAQKLRYPQNPEQSGSLYSAQVSAVRALTPSSSAQLRVGSARQLARGPSLARWSWFGGLGYYRDLRGGFSVYLDPSFTLSRHDAADPLFGRHRVDHLTEIQIVLLNRRLVLFRFTPRVAYTWARRRSTISLYQFNQHRVEIGLTSRF